MIPYFPPESTPIIFLIPEPRQGDNGHASGLRAPPEPLELQGDATHHLVQAELPNAELGIPEQGREYDIMPPHLRMGGFYGLSVYSLPKKGREGHHNP